MTTPAEPPESVRRDIQQIVENTQSRLGDLHVSPLGQTLLQGILLVLKRASDYDDLEQKLGRLLSDLDSGRAALQQTLDDTAAAEAAWIGREQFGEVWWKRRQREVAEAFEAGQETGRRRWLATYAEALIAGRFDVCQQMTLNEWPTPDGVEMLQTGAAALLERRYRDAVESVEMLAGADDAGTDATTRAALLVFLGRIHLYELSNVTAAREWIERACQLAADDGRPRAALGECLRVGGEPAAAQQQFMSAVQLSPQATDGHIGLALICEDQRSWHRALDFYDDAIDAAGQAAHFGLLLAPAPAGLYWQLARRRKQTAPAQALEDIDRAIQLGVRWAGSYPERRALRDRAEILESLGRGQDAADAYFEAGRRYSWLGKAATARPLLEEACALNPGHALAHWQLSEVLRVLSYRREAPFVDPDLVGQSRKHWEEGWQLRRPDPATAWVYLGRALLNEQRWVLHKDPAVLQESLIYLESALLLSGKYATAWAYLGLYHRGLNNLQAALEATERAVSISPTDVAALEQASAVLILLGRYRRAEEMIDRRLAQAEEWGAVSLKAYVQLCTGREEEALKLTERAVGAVPDEERYRSLRGLCLYRLDRYDEAAADYRWIWDHRATPAGALWDSQAVAWAGYLLGEFDEAARILQAAIEEEPLSPHVLWCALGQIWLARGDLAQDDIANGVAALRRGIGLVRNAGQLEDMLGLDLDVLERIIATRPDPGPSQDGLARVRALVAEAQESLSASVTTAGDELRAIADTAPEGCTAWLAARAALARTASTAGQWQVALGEYRALKPYPAFPEADRGLARALSHLQQEADRLVADGMIGTAREHYEELLAVAAEELGASANVTVDLALRAGFAAVSQSDDAAVRRHLGQVLPGADVPGRLGKFADAEQLFVRSPVQYWELVDALRGLQRDYGPDARESELLDGLIGQLDLSRLYRLAAADVATFPVATPLTLRVGPGLEPVDRAGRAALQQDLEDLRARVESGAGFWVPGVRLASGGAPGDYLILIDDTPVAAGSIPVDGHFTLPDQPRPGRRDRDPLTGRCGVWDGPGEVRPAEQPAWPPLGFVLRHLEATICRSLSSFIGPDDVQAWLDRAPAKDTALARVVLPDRSARLLLSRVLQVLAREGVPLTAQAAVLKAMRDAPAGACVLDLAAAVRVQMRPSLPGNAAGTPRVPVPAGLEQALAAGLHRENGSLIWQLPRRETGELIDQVRHIDAGAVAGTQAALVARSGELRPFLWRLISAEFPYLSVLSEEELVEHQGESSAPADAVPGHPAGPGGPVS